MDEFEEITAIIGDPHKIDQELSQFRETSRLLSPQAPRMIEQYPDKWVALYDQEVQAVGDSMDEVLAQIDRKELPRHRVIVRFIAQNPRTMIL